MKYQISNKKILLLYIFIPIELITFFSNFFSLYLHKYESIHILSTVFLITGHLLLLILLQDKLLCKWLLLYWIISFCLRIYYFLFFVSGSQAYSFDFTTLSHTIFPDHYIGQAK